MTFKEFKESLASAAPASHLDEHLKALWYAGKDDWETSHTIIQDIDDANAAWIHAYLHRQEGDIANAEYWYRRAGRKNPGTTLEQEWESISSALIKE